MAGTPDPFAWAHRKLVSGEKSRQAAQAQSGASEEAYGHARKLQKHQHRHEAFITASQQVHEAGLQQGAQAHEAGMAVSRQAHELTLQQGAQAHEAGMARGTQRHERKSARAGQAHEINLEQVRSANRISEFATHVEGVKRLPKGASLNSTLGDGHGATVRRDFKPPKPQPGPQAPAVAAAGTANRPAAPARQEPAQGPAAGESNLSPRQIAARKGAATRKARAASPQGPVTG